MSFTRGLIAALVVVLAGFPIAASAEHRHGSSAPDDIIYDLTHPWPFHKGKTTTSVSMMDSDRDGVVNGVDQCPNTPMAYAVDSNGCPIPVNDIVKQFLKQRSVSMQIQFAWDKSDILAESEPDLNQVGEVLAAWPHARIRIEGYADSQGTEEYNEALSERRAASVKAWFLSHYPSINRDNLSTKGFGEGSPTASNETPAGRAENRRVTFRLMNADDISKDIETHGYKKRGE